jgi:hypothetical protein
VVEIGRRLSVSDQFFWAYTAVLVSISVLVAVVTGSLKWGVFAFCLIVFAASVCQRRYRRSLG